MGLKTIRTSIRLDKADIDFLKEVGVFENMSQGVRWCIKFCRLYGIAAIKDYIAVNPGRVGPEK